MSFDCKPTGYDSLLWIRLRGNGTPIQAFCDRGVFCYYENTEGWDISQKRIAYDLNKWYNIDIYADLSSKTIYSYVDNKLLGVTNISGNVPDLRYIDIVNEGSTNDIYLDNITFEAINPVYYKLPIEIREKGFLDISCNETGRIFFDANNQKFNLKIRNKTNENNEYKIIYSVKKDNNTVFGGNCFATVNAGETISKEISTAVNGYGFYSISAKLCDNKGVLIFQTDDYKFSVANASSEDFKDENFGFQHISTDQKHMDPNSLITVLPLMDKLGTSITRGGISSFGQLNENEELNPVSSWDEGILNTLINAGYEKLPILYGTSSVFKNNKGEIENPPHSEEVLDKFAKYAVLECDLYKSYYGHSPKYIDVWNEFWMEGNVFNPDRATAVDYANMLKKVYTAVKAKHPDTNVLGLSGANWDAFGYAPYTWTKDVLKALGSSEKYMDGISMHPYNDWGNPEGGDFVNLVSTYKYLFAQYGYDDIKCYATEWGWPSGGSDGDASKLPNETEQASYFVRANVINKANNLFDLVMWYGSTDCGNNDLERQETFGLLRGAFDEIAYEAKPQYLSAANYQKLMFGSTFISQSKISDQVTKYKFELSDGNSAIILWAKNTPETVNLNLGAKNIKFVDVFGNEEQLSDTNGNYSINVGILPVYLIGNF